MKIAYFDCFSGISGDMILGALVDAGADFETLREHLHTLPVDGYRIERRVVRKHEIAGVKIDVRIETAPGVEVVEGPGDDTPFHASSHETVHDHAAHHTFPPSAHGHGHPPHDHGHVHTHPDEPVLEEHDHDVAHAHPHTHEHTHPHDGHRHLAELVGLIRTSGLNPSIKDRAIEIFDLLAEAEGVVHGIP
ncbi:MAG: DUF111 family protein, partial [candidate division Zixibacteria bacterium]|nr:DUF111 family protein [candidate division Zixibacteria bacterium]